MSAALQSSRSLALGLFCVISIAVQGFAAPAATGNATSQRGAVVGSIIHHNDTAVSANAAPAAAAVVMVGLWAPLPSS